MCIAAIINSALPQEYLNEMEHDNPHGGGVAYQREVRGKTKLVYIKGLKAAEIGRLQTSGVITYPYLLHFRWATHGARSMGMAHPFPVGRAALYGATTGTTNKVLIHNGIWNKYSEYLGLVKAPAKFIKDASDTAIAAYIIGEYPDFEADLLREVPWACATGALGKAGMEITKYGDTWTQYTRPGAEAVDGNWYSNLSWLPAKEWYASNKSRWAVSTGKRYYYASGWGGSGSDVEDLNAATWGVPKSDLNSFTTTDGTKYVWDPAQKIYRQQGTETRFDSIQSTPTKPTHSDHYDTWNDYCKARYGDEVAAGVRSADEDREDTQVGPEIEDDSDIISDDPAEVNAWLAKEYQRGNAA